MIAIPTLIMIGTLVSNWTPVIQLVEPLVQQQVQAYMVRRIIQSELHQKPKVVVRTRIVYRCPPTRNHKVS